MAVLWVQRPSLGMALLVYCTLYWGGGIPMAMLEETGYLLVLAGGLEEERRSEEDAEELG